MFRIAKNFVRTLEESVTGTVGEKPVDSYFHSVPPQLFPIKEDDPRYSQQTDSLYGLRIVQVAETQLQLNSFFDYIIGFNNQPVPLMQDASAGASQTFYPDYRKIVSLFNEHCGNTIKLHVWCGKGGVYREEYVYVSAKDSVSEIPLDETDAQCLVTSKMFEPLGFRVQWTPLAAATYSYHVLQLNIENGPAMQAGLIPDQDYIIACQDGLLATGGEHLLQDIVRSRANHSLVLYVYNKAVDCVRPVTVQIAADGRLGCNVGYGFLHRIPAPVQNIETSAAISTSGSSRNSNIILPAGQPNLVPAPIPLKADNNDPASSSTPLLPVPVSRKTTQHHRTTDSNNAAAASVLMADYFQEGKDQSPRYSAKATPPPPPPTSTAANAAT
ncbi:unnamed protein product [Kluyveromyces dobzhanskii CBS 2104]|uniref:WGS project CCBQ000000000 data, contig MAT n=1 Tax=Kluyveromyces dobzhanskii CBS 2104 TaxID=1427455 RepID=A0A0A8L101_9SACH|nr:unnamed protein product [Kluyveromyces dobzhanskii CBS 2104]